MILAVDIGGTKTLVALFDEAGNIGKKQQFPTPSNYDAFMNALVGTAHSLWQPDITCIAVAAPGIIDPVSHHVIKFGNLPWRDVDIAGKLHQEFDVQVFIENDANAGGLAAVAALETTPALALYVTVGTGIGTGIIAHGRIEPALAKSEGGHMVLREGDQLITWESFASGRAIRREFNKLASEITDPGTWQEIASHLSTGLLALLPTLQPDVVLIGGGIGTHFEQYQAALHQELAAHLPEYIDMPTIVQAPNPEEIVVHGCYQMANQSLAAA